MSSKRGRHIPKSSDEREEYLRTTIGREGQPQDTASPTQRVVPEPTDRPRQATEPVEVTLTEPGFDIGVWTKHHLSLIVISLLTLAIGGLFSYLMYLNGQLGELRVRAEDSLPKADERLEKDIDAVEERLSKRIDENNEEIDDLDDRLDEQEKK